MSRMLFCIMLLLSKVPLVQAQQAMVYPVAYVTTENQKEDAVLTRTVSASEIKVTAIPQLITAIAAKEQTRFVVGLTRAKRLINVYYFPGRSNKRALVIGGVHGTELSSMEVAKTLIEQLAAGDTPYYNVLVIPTLFPDNAAQALQQNAEIGSVRNIGRYTHTEAADPNRQMPPLGKAYNEQTNTDALGRPIEYENRLLLQLIQNYKPQRIINIHAIRDTAQGGIYADPRTNAAGYAHGFTSDSSLALGMAAHIEKNGGAAPGNKVPQSPTAVYYKDPPVVPPGQWQRRSCHSMQVPGARGHGVSLGSWASTEVCDSANAIYNRPPIRLFTMEFPGYKRPQDYAAAQQPYYQKQVRLYAEAIQNIFLNAHFVED